MLALLLFAGQAAPAQTVQEHDRHGLPQGRSKRHGDGEQFHDAQGLPQGRTERHGDVIEFHGRDGLPQGRDVIKE